LNRKALIIIIISVAAITLISGVVFAVVSRSNDRNSVAASSDNSDTENDFTYITPTLEDNSDSVSEAPEPVIDEEITSFVPADKMDLDPSSITVYVNKEYCLPKDYKPKNLVTPNIRFDITYYDEKTLMRPEAAKALEKLFAAAEKNGYTLFGVSAYRSFDRQYKIFTNNIATQGKEHTLMYSAVPGTSEHQTGLAIDVSVASLNNKLSDEFADTPEGKWLAHNSYKYGFIIRYTKDKAAITGYAYEPWHIRFVGRGLAYYLYTNQLTLDEYYKYTPSPDFDFEALYADIINYVPPTLTPTVTPTPSITPTVTPKEEKGKGKEDGQNPSKEPTGESDNNPEISLSPTPAPTPTPTPSEVPAVTVIPPEGNGDDMLNLRLLYL
jgi:D-alanyl-D-alanine carboxypeptidase